MLLSDAAEKPLVFDVKEKLSKVIGRLNELDKHDAFVFNGTQFLGVISAKDIVRKGFTDPENVKLANLGGVIKGVKVFGDDTPLKTVINNFLINNYRCIPVEKDGAVLSLNKLDLLRLIPRESLKGKKASDVMFFPECVSSADPISVVKSIFRNSNVYRIAVMGGGNKVEGVVDEMDLLKGFTERSRVSRGEKSGEKVHEMEIPISSHLLMQGSHISESPQTDLKYVVGEMLEKNNDTVIVEEDGKLVGMITPREILKLVGAEIGGVYVNVAGIQNEDGFLQDVVDSEIRTAIRKLAKMIHIHYMTLNVKKKATTGKSGDYRIKTKRTNYTVRGKLVANKGAFFAEDSSWDLIKSTQATLKKLEKEVIKKIGKERSIDRDQNIFGGESQE